MPPPLQHYRTHGLTLRPCGALWSLPSPLERSQIQSPIPVPKFPFFHSPSFFYRGRHFGIGGLETPQGSRAKPARCLSWLRFGNKVLCGQLGPVHSARAFPMIRPPKKAFITTERGEGGKDTVRERNAIHIPLLFFPNLCLPGAACVPTPTNQN